MLLQQPSAGMPRNDSGAVVIAKWTGRKTATPRAKAEGFRRKIPPVFASLCGLSLRGRLQPNAKEDEDDGVS